MDFVGELFVAFVFAEGNFGVWRRAKNRTSTAMPHGSRVEATRVKDPPDLFTTTPHGARYTARWG